MIFLTGSTGFLGGVLFRTLYKSLPDSEFALLVRAASMAEANQKILDSNPSLLKKQSEQEIFKRIRPIIGDLSKKDLQINSYDKSVLLSDCAHIYHCGANTNLSHNYEESKVSNLHGTTNLLSLADSITTNNNSLIFNHISTAYVAGDTNKTVSGNC